MSDHTVCTTRPRPSRAAMSKVPEITVYFWLIKLLTTAMGEATSDFLVLHMNHYLAVALGFIGLVVSLLLQFSVKRYVTWVYWLVVVMVSIFGTMAADATHIVLGVPYLDSTLFFFAVMVALLIAWKKTEGTLSIHSIYTRRREIFYWLTVLAAFAFGTAIGDMTATTLSLGYATSGIVFAVLMFLPLIAYRMFGLNDIAAFWFAYIMTRPVGASFADWFGVEKAYGGLGFGRGPVSLTLTVCIISLVGYLMVSGKDRTLNTRRLA